MNRKIINQIRMYLSFFLKSGVRMLNGWGRRGWGVVLPLFRSTHPPGYGGVGWHGYCLGYSGTVIAGVVGKSSK